MNGAPRKSSSKLVGSKGPSIHSTANSSNQSNQSHKKNAPPPHSNPQQHSKNANHPPTKQHPRHLQSASGGLPQYVSVLDKCDEVVVKEGVEFWSRRENYAVYDAYGRNLFFCRQFTDCCSSSLYNMSIHGFSNGGGSGEEVIRIVEPQDWCAIRDYLVVESPPGFPIGKIVKMIGFLSSNFEIKGPDGSVILKIKSPIVTTSFGGDVEFKVFRPEVDEAEAVQVGKISKKWSGFLKEAFTHRDNFGIVFFKNGKFTTLERVLLLAACIFIDIKYYGDDVKDHNTWGHGGKY